MRPNLQARLQANIDYHEKLAEHHRMTAKAFREPPEQQQGDGESESRSLVPVDADDEARAENEKPSAQLHAEHNDRMADLHAEVSRQLRDLLPKPAEKQAPPPFRRTTEPVIRGNRS